MDRDPLSPEERAAQREIVQGIGRLQRNATRNRKSIEEHLRMRTEEIAREKAAREQSEGA